MRKKNLKKGESLEDLDNVLDVGDIFDMINVTNIPQLLLNADYDSAVFLMACMEP